MKCLSQRELSLFQGESNEKLSETESEWSEWNVIGEVVKLGSEPRRKKRRVSATP